MKPDIRWQVLLAVITLGLVLSVLSFQVQTANLCSVSVPATGGVLVEGMVGAPQRLNPLLSDANPVDQELVSLIFDGLTRYNSEGQLQPALARSWDVSEDGLTVSFELREDARWHDGRPVTAADVVFTYGLLQEDDFMAPPDVKLLWQSVVISATGSMDVTFTLPSPYAPFLDATTRGLLPAHILNNVAPAALADHSFNQAPVGTGPFKMVPGNNWRQNGRLRLAPYETYWWQGVNLDALEFRFYPDDTSLLEAFAGGDIQAINRITAAALPEAAVLPGMRLFTAPAPRYTQLLFNLTDSGAPAMGRLEMRQALAQALDRQLLLDEALRGQGLLLDGPYLPTSWVYIPGAITDYGNDPATAVALLESAGWLLPEGATVRQQEGQSLTLRLLFIDEPAPQALAAEIARQWTAMGVGVELLPVQPGELREALALRLFDVALVDVDPPGDPDFYDFWSQEAIIQGQNYAGWNNRRASEALEAARQLWVVEERQPYYAAFLRFFNNDLPALTLYQHVYTYGLSESVQRMSGGLADIGRIDHPRDRYQTMDDWFLFYRDVTVTCPDQDA